MMRKPACRVSRISLRVESASSTGARPADSSSGRASPRMRPLARASVSTSADTASGYPLDPRAQLAEPNLEPLVAAVEVVDPIDDRLAPGDEAGDDQARGGAQVGGHDVRPGERLHAMHHRGIALDVDMRAQAA